MRRGRIYPAQGVYGVGRFACGYCPPLHFGGFRVLRFGFRRLFRVILAEQPGKGFELAFAVEVNPQAAFAVLVFDAHLAAGDLLEGGLDFGRDDGAGEGVFFGFGGLGRAGQLAAERSSAFSNGFDATALHSFETNSSGFSFCHEAIE